jgi:hypothetical protein
MIEESEQLTERLVHLSSESRQNETPRGSASDRTVRSIGAALHTLDHQFSKSGYAKIS